MRYVVVGDTSADLILEVDEKEIHTTTTPHERDLLLPVGLKLPAKAGNLAIGGNAANVTTALHRLDASAKLVSHIGQDALGDFLSRELGIAGVSRGSVARVAHSGFASVLLSGGDRTVISHHAKGRYDLPFLNEDDVLILSSVGANGEKIIAETLTGQHAVVFLPATHQLQRPVLCRRILKKSRLVCLNKEEAQRITGTKLQDIALLAERLLDYGVREAVVTDGIRGAASASDVGIFTIGIWQAVRRYDPTGAGDAFAATYIWARGADESPDVALQLATLNAGQVVTTIGAQTALMTAAMLRRLLRSAHVPKVSRAHV